MTPDSAQPTTAPSRPQPRRSATTDRHGHPLTGADQRAASGYDRAVGALLRYSDDVEDAWEETVAGEPDFVMGQIGRAYLRCISSERSGAEDAQRILDAIGDEDRLTSRERHHLAAARAYAAGDLHGASERLARLSVEHPLDALALSIGHQLDFFTGDAMGLRDRIGRTLVSWDESDPWFAFVLGMQAFGLEECGHYAQAEDVAMRALDLDARNVWAHHAVLHVHEMQGRFTEGLRFADRRRAAWETGNVFVVHNAWHEALFHLENDDTAAALDIYDRLVHHPGSANVALELLDASALLWRLHLTGDDTGDRWAPLADAWSRNLDRPWYVFNDVHAVMAFVGASRLDDARAVLGDLAVHASQPPGAISNVEMTAEVGLSVGSALLAYGEGRFGDVVELLHPIRTIVHRFGGSHAQRDVVARTLLESAIRSGQVTLATALVSERLALKADSPFNRLQLGRVRRLGGDSDAASAVGERAATRRSIT